MTHLSFALPKIPISIYKVRDLFWFGRCFASHEWINVCVICVLVSLVFTINIQLTPFFIWLLFFFFGFLFCYGNVCVWRCISMLWCWCLTYNLICNLTLLGIFRSIQWITKWRTPTKNAFFLSQTWWNWERETKMFSKLADFFLQKIQLIYINRVCVRVPYSNNLWINNNEIHNSNAYLSVLFFFYLFFWRCFFMNFLFTSFHGRWTMDSQVSNEEYL